MADAVTAEIRVRRGTIDCKGCETTIERFLGREAGVQSVKASEQLQSVTVDWDPDATSLDEVKAKLADLGYPAEWRVGLAATKAFVSARPSARRGWGVGGDPHAD